MSQSSASRGNPQGNTCAVFNVLCVVRHSFYMFLIIFRYLHIYMCVCMCIIYIYVCVCVYIFTIILYIYIGLHIMFTTFLYHEPNNWPFPPSAHHGPTPGRVVRQVSWSLAPWGPRNARGRRSLREWSRRATSPAAPTVGKSWGSTQCLKWSMEWLKGKSTGNHGFCNLSWFFSHHPILWNDGSHN